MRVCEVCRNRYHDCSVRECIKKPGHWICFSCCRKCKWGYVSVVGVGCKAYDTARASAAAPGRAHMDEETEEDES